jgi:hypothetical protein
MILKKKNPVSVMEDRDNHNYCTKGGGLREDYGGLLWLRVVSLQGRAA